MTEDRQVVSINADVDKIRAELAEQEARLKGGRGGGTYDGMDAWQTSVETRLTELSSRVLWLAGGLALGFVTVIGLLLARTDGLGTRVDGLSDRMAKVEASVERLDERTAAMQKQMDGMDTKLDKLLAK